MKEGRVLAIISGPSFSSFLASLYPYDISGDGGGVRRESEGIFAQVSKSKLRE
jgi:hypothetical protein